MDPDLIPRSRDPCRHARRERDSVGVPNHVADDTEVDVELVLTTSGPPGGQYEGHTVYRVKLRDEPLVKLSSHTSYRVTPAVTVERSQRDLVQLERYLNQTPGSQTHLPPSELQRK